MTAAERRAKAEQAGYTVWRSDWEASGGATGISWVVTRPGGLNLDDYQGSEAAGWRAAYKDMRQSALAA